MKLYFLCSLICSIALFSLNADSLKVHPLNSQIQPSEKEFFENILPKLKNKKIILVTNPSGIGRSPENILRKLKEYQIHLQSLIGLEHGFLGLEEDFSKSAVSEDKTFGVPIYHIYKLKPNELKEVIWTSEVIVFDVQDMGMRCYTYITVLKRILDAMNEFQEIVILDHINPSLQIGVKGDLHKKEFENFASEFPLPLFTGLTLGEAALYYNSEHLQNSKRVIIIPVKGYKRYVQYEQTGIPWLTPSPNLPTLDSARNYFALVLLEGINVSVGRGTQSPFLVFGAPWMIEPERMIPNLEKESNFKYNFQPVFFRPTFSKYANKICRGLRMEVNSENYDPIRLAFLIISTIKRTYPTSFQWEKGKFYTIDLLWGNDRFRKAIEDDLSFEEFYKTFSKVEEKYSTKVKKYLLY